MQQSGQFHARNALALGETAFGAHWGAPETVWRGGEDETFLPCRKSNPGRPVHILVYVLTELHLVLRS